MLETCRRKPFRTSPAPLPSQPSDQDLRQGGVLPLHALMPRATLLSEVLSGNLTARSVKICQKAEKPARIVPTATYALLAAAFRTRQNHTDSFDGFESPSRHLEGQSRNQELHRLRQAADCSRQCRAASAPEPGVGERAFVFVSLEGRAEGLRAEKSEGHHPPGSEQGRRAVGEWSLLGRCTGKSGA